MAKHNFNQRGRRGSTYSGISTLTLSRDVVLKFTGGAGLHLHKLANLENYNTIGVHFTSFKDDTKAGDTNGDGSATSPNDGDWDGIWDDEFDNYRKWTNVHYAANKL